MLANAGTIADNNLFTIFTGLALVAGVKFAMFDGAKEHGLVVVEGRFELMQPEEAEEEEPKVFEISEDGKRYGGAFAERRDLVEHVEKNPPKERVMARLAKAVTSTLS